MEPLSDATIVLEPLEARHAEAMYAVLRDVELYRHLDRAPPASVEALREEYRRLERRSSPDGLQAWLNWVVRPVDADPVGFVQATVEGGNAWIAYVFARASWGHGYATRACRLMIDHLAADHGVERFMAVTEEANTRSIALLRRLGFEPATGSHGVTLTPSERLFVR